MVRGVKGDIIFLHYRTQYELRLVVVLLVQGARRTVAERFAKRSRTGTDAAGRASTAHYNRPSFDLLHTPFVLAR